MNEKKTKKQSGVESAVTDCPAVAKTCFRLFSFERKKRKFEKEEGTAERWLPCCCGEPLMPALSLASGLGARPPTDRPTPALSTRPSLKGRQTRAMGAVVPTVSRLLYGGP